MSREEIIKADFFIQWAFRGIMFLAATAISAFILDMSSKVDDTHEDLNKFKVELNGKISRIETLLELYSKNADNRDQTIREIQKTVDKQK